MSRSDGYEDEMARRDPSDEQIEALLRGDEPGSDLADVAGSLDALRSLGEVTVPEDVVAAHVAMASRAAAVSSGTARTESAPVSKTTRPRRRIVLNTLLTSLLAKVLAATVALASVGTGLVVAADHAAPGDALYGIDRAVEAVGILDGGVEERVAEARGLVDVNLPDAVATAGEAVEDAGDSQSAAALSAAADRIRESVADAPDGEQSALTRQHVADLLDLLSEQRADGTVDGAAVAAAAKAIHDTVLPEPVTLDEVPPVDTGVGDVPPGEIPPVPTTIPDEATDHMPTTVPPVTTP